MRISDWSSDVCSSDLTLQQYRHAVADETGDRGEVERPVAALGQEGGHGGVDVGHAVDQGAVEIEDDGPGALLLRQGTKILYAGCAGALNRPPCAIHNGRESCRERECPSV